MTLRIHAPNPIRVGETANVLVTSDNPGVVSLTYGAGLTGPASVTITGTRVWRNGLKHGQYLARANCLQARENCAWFLDVNTADLLHVNGGSNNDYTVIRVVQNFKVAAVSRANYSLYLHSAKTAATTQFFRFGFGASPTDATNEANTVGPDHQLAAPKVERCIWTYDGSRLKQYTTSGVTASVDVARSIAGTMGGSEMMVISFPCKFGKMEGGLPSEAERVAFISSGTLPPGLAASYQGGHEIVESAPVFWDTSGNDLDLSDVDVDYWPEAAASGDYTDTVPVVPYTLVPVTVVATTGTTIDATRPRQGVPARASEAEKTETADQVTVTVEAPLVSIGPDTDATVEAYPANVYLQLCAQPDGIVSLASDDPNLTVPETVEVSGGSATVTCTASADVSGATVTATYGDTTDTASVTVTEAAAPAETLVIGPDVTASVDSYPAVIKLLVTSNTDGEVTVESDDTNIIPDSPVNVVSGEAEMECLVIADVTGATLTASRLSGVSDTCTVTVGEIPAEIKEESDQVIGGGYIPSVRSIVARGAVLNKLRWSCAMRLKLYSTTNTGYNNLFAVGKMESYDHAAFAIAHKSQEVYLIFRNAGDTETRYLASSQSLPLNEWVDLIITYDYDTSTNDGLLSFYLDSDTPTEVVLGADDKLSSSITGLSGHVGSAHGQDVSICHLTVSNAVAWNLATVQGFLLGNPIDGTNYSAYWPMIRHNSADTLTDYDRAGHIPLYITGPTPLLSWVDAP